VNDTPTGLRVPCTSYGMHVNGVVAHRVRTHLGDATPIRLGDELRACAVRRATEPIGAREAWLGEIPRGGTAKQA
jgi:fumarate hydratase class II